MNTSSYFRLMLLATLVVISGCSSTPSRPDLESSQGMVWRRPVEKVQKAAVDALVVLGFNVVKTESLYVEGEKPRQSGLFVSSGGESVGVWLERMGSDTTRFAVSTGKSFVGIAGQRNWDEAVVVEMKRAIRRMEHPGSE